MSVLLFLSYDTSVPLTLTIKVFKGSLLLAKLVFKLVLLVYSNTLANHVPVGSNSIVPLVYIGVPVVSVTVN